MTSTTFKAEQNAPLTPEAAALEQAWNTNISALDLAALVAGFFTMPNNVGRNTMWSEQGMILKGIADVAYRKLHTKKTWINRNNEEVSLGVMAQYNQAVKRTNAADKLDDGTEIAGRHVDEALAHELERKHAKEQLEAFITAVGMIYEHISGKPYEPWMPEEKNPRAETATQKAKKQDREARKARLAEARG